MKPTETRLRTFARALTWRLLGVALTILLTWWYFRDVRLGVELGLAYNAIRLVLHYFHDRLWARVPWGHAHPVAAEPRQEREHAWC